MVRPSGGNPSPIITPTQLSDNLQKVFNLNPTVATELANNYPPEVAYPAAAVISIESGGNPTANSGPYHGLFQTDQPWGQGNVESQITDGIQHVNSWVNTINGNNSGPPLNIGNNALAFSSIIHTPGILYNSGNASYQLVQGESPYYTPVRDNNNDGVLTPQDNYQEMINQSPSLLDPSNREVHYQVFGFYPEQSEQVLSNTTSLAEIPQTHTSSTTSNTSTSPASTTSNPPVVPSMGTVQNLNPTVSANLNVNSLIAQADRYTQMANAFTLPTTPSQSQLDRYNRLVEAYCYRPEPPLSNTQQAVADRYSGMANHPLTNRTPVSNPANHPTTPTANPVGGNNKGKKKGGGTTLPPESTEQPTTPNASSNNHSTTNGNGLTQGQQAEADRYSGMATAAGHPPLDRGQRAEAARYSGLAQAHQNNNQNNNHNNDDDDHGSGNNSGGGNNNNSGGGGSPAPSSNKPSGGGGNNNSGGGGGNNNSGGGGSSGGGSSGGGSSGGGGSGGGGSSSNSSSGGGTHFNRRAGH